MDRACTVICIDEVGLGAAVDHIDHSSLFVVIGLIKLITVL